MTEELYDPLDMVAPFRRRRLAAWLLVPVILLAVFWVEALAGFAALVATLIVLAVAWGLVWRCPSCTASLPAERHVVRCPRCSAHLMPESGGWDLASWTMLCYYVLLAGSVGMIVVRDRARARQDREVLALGQQVRRAVMAYQADTDSTPRQVADLLERPSDAGWNWGGPYLEAPLDRWRMFSLVRIGSGYRIDAASSNKKVFGALTRREDRERMPPIPGSPRDEAWERTARQAYMRINPLKRAIQAFRKDTGRSPATLKELVDRPAGTTAWKGPYMHAAYPFLDHTGKPIQYHRSGRGLRLVIGRCSAQIAPVDRK